MYSYDRRTAAAMLNPEYLAKLIKKLDPMLVADAPIRLERLMRDLASGSISPFPVSELGGYLRDRRVDEDEVEHVQSIKIRAPQKRKVKSFSDAWMALGKVMGVNVIFDGRLQHDDFAVAAVEAWTKGFRKVKPKAKAIFGRLVKKVELQRPYGSEDAMWKHSGVMALSIKTSPQSPAGAAGSITHELGHAVEEAKRVNLRAAPWGEAPFITDYAQLKPHIEDFAESFRVFIERPSELRRVAPAKFDALKSIV